MCCRLRAFFFLGAAPFRESAPSNAPVRKAVSWWRPLSARLFLLAFRVRCLDGCCAVAGPSVAGARPHDSRFTTLVLAARDGAVRIVTRRRRVRHAREFRLEVPSGFKRSGT